MIKKKINAKRPADDGLNPMAGGTANNESPPRAPAGGTGAVKTAAKIIVIWVPLAVAGLVVVIMAALPLVLSPKRVETIAAEAFRLASYGELSMKVKRFNPYRGFEIENLVIYNGEEFGRSKFVEIERLVFDYGFFGMLVGRVRFNEIGIYRPRIHLIEKNGVWNAERLMKASAEKPGKEQKEEKKEEGVGPSKEIGLPISLDFLFKFVIEDFRLYARGTGLNASVEGLGFTADILVPPFRKVPKSPEAVALLERMSIALNPKGELDVSVYTPDVEVNPPLVLSWKFDFNKGKAGNNSFASAFRFGTNRTPVRFKRSRLAPLSLMIGYDMVYDPAVDNLRLDHFSVRFAGSTWLNLAGTVRNVTTRQEIDIRMTHSAIALDELYPYYAAITGDRLTRFGGVISLYPLTIKGNPSSMDVNGELALREITYKMPGIEAALPHARLGFTALRRADDIKLLARLAVPRFSYALERSKSGDNGVEMAMDASAPGNFGRVKLQSFSFRFFNPADGQNALEVGATAEASLGAAPAGKLNVDRFRFRKAPLMAMLPASLRKSLDGLPLTKPLDLSLDASFGIKGEKTNAAAVMKLIAPDFDLTDLRLDVDLAQDGTRKRLTLSRFHLGSEAKGLDIDARGTVDIETPPFSDSDLRLGIKLKAPELAAVYGPWKIKGLVDIGAAVRGDLKNGRAFGSIKIGRFFVQNDEERIAVDDLNMDFPFDYYFTPRYRGESRIATDKSLLISNEYFREKANFTIKSIRAKHPARDVSFEYLKDFSATMAFRENTFEIPAMRAYVLDGSLYGRDILFNLADMKPRNMEFRVALDVTNVDIGRLDDPDSREKRRDAELSLNANFVGRGVDIERELSAQGYVNIHKIGEKFARGLLKGLSTEKGTSKLGGVAQFAVDNSMNVKGFNFNLDRGLVYATVTFSRRAIGYLFGVKDEKVEFDRMPIQEYLRKVGEVER
ncbi:MAG TPA: hypothetical protein VLM75_07365 [Spirochaetota bacterium]|nr:hypothetical protein [Spirochaetota bacterium]